MKALVDTNVLVYRFDPRNPTKQLLAQDLLRTGIQAGSLCIAHQAIIEFVQAVTRPLTRGGASLLTREDALQEAEELLVQFEVLHPTEAVLRTAIRGAAAYRLGWFDAHMWAYAEVHGLNEFLSEDFPDGQMLGGVQIRNPFNIALHQPRGGYSRRS